MTHSTKFPVSEEIKASLQNNSKDVRFLVISIVDESVVLEKTINVSGTPQEDFDSLTKHISENNPRFLLFKEKQWGDKPWAFISYIPDKASVNERMLYSSCAQHLKDELGYEKISADKHFSDPKELTWNSYKGFESTDKPWSKKELAIQQLNKEEETARNEFLNRPQKASGFHTVSYPLTEDAKQAIEKFKSKEFNWVQFSLDKDQKNICCVTTKNVNTSSMSEHLDTINPQFYLLSFEGSSVLVYSCPKDSPIKFKMVYSTCKASFAETLKSNGISIVKKFDVISPDELNANDLREKIREKSSTMFKPNENGGSSGNVVKGTNYSSTGGRIFFNQAETNKPVFQRFNNDNNNSHTSTSKKLNVIKETNPLAKVMGFGNGTPKKGIVIPPKGAYE